MYKYSLAVGLSMFCNMALAQTPFNLITSVTPDTKPPHQERYIEAWTADFNVRALRSGLPAIWLNLPDGTVENINLVHFEAREGYLEVDIDGDEIPEPVPLPNAADSEFSWRWYGRSEKWTVAITMEYGEIAGRITSADQRFGISPIRGGRARLGLSNSAYWQMHPEDSGRPIEEGVATSRSSDARNGDTMRTQLYAQTTTTTSSWDHSCVTPLSADIRHIDVLAFYTLGVLLENGSLAGVKAAIRSAIDDANQSLSNSDINRVRFWLTGIEPADSTYDYDAADIEEALEMFGGWRTTTTPPYISDSPNAHIQARRDAYGADIMALARDPGDDASCGVAIIQNARAEFADSTSNVYEFAYSPGSDFKKFSYLVFNPACNVDRLNLAHELGHILGMEHDPRNSSPGRYTPSCRWSYGHRRAGSLTEPKRFRTVMSYFEMGTRSFGSSPPLIPPAGCIGSAGEGCPLIDAYSTPEKEWTGFSISPPGTVAGSSLIGVHPLSGSAGTYNGAKANDTLVRMAAVVEGFNSRSASDLIFSSSFEKSF